MGKVQVVVGGQFGSEGKGAIAAHLAKGRSNLLAVRVAGPNAGHSALDSTGHKWALRQVPVMAVVNQEALLIIAAGSEIDEEVLHHEVELLDKAGFDVSRRLFIDGQATVITEEHKVAEGNIATGTTGKGIGAARADRLLRGATTWEQRYDAEEEYGSVVTVPCDTAHMLAAHLQAGRDVIVEGTQGFGLGLHAGYYPYCTSSDCRAVDFLAMAGITPWAPWVSEVEPIVVCRTYPIRIAGNSGPMLGETTWEDLAIATDDYIKPEYTTVTQKLRRVGVWDPELAMRAVRHNGGPSARVALTFFDYVFPELSGSINVSDLTDEHHETLAEFEAHLGTQVEWLGTGPDSVIEL